MEVELSKWKLDLDEACKATTHLFKKQGEARKDREHLFNEWEHIQLHIRELNRDLVNETKELIKLDMEKKLTC